MFNIALPKASCAVVLKNPFGNFPEGWTPSALGMW
jgi:hypothetical protein